MNRSNARRIVAIALVGAVGLVACGDDDETEGSTPAGADAAATIPATDAAPATEYVEEADEVYDVPSTEAPASVAETTPAPADASTLTISDFTFSSPTVTAGVAFTLTNDDGFGHTVTSRDDLFSVGVDGGASESLTIEQPGTYEIFCRIHPSMEGTITVV
jgi:plastocyanin